MSGRSEVNTNGRRPIDRRRSAPRRGAAAILLAALASVAPWVSGAAAMDFVVHQPVIFAYGDIKNGDQYEFKKLLKAQPAGQIRGVDLNSDGGFVYAAGEIARTIRENKLLTLVDAKRSRCTSACTILFAGGRGRIYLNAGGVPDGVTGKSVGGLGFHEGSSSDSRDPNSYSGQGTAQVIAYYYEFGIPRAADLITAAPPDAIYMVSGPKALALGIATSLGSAAGGSEGARHKPRRH